VDWSASRLRNCLRIRGVADRIDNDRISGLVKWVNKVGKKLVDALWKTTRSRRKGVRVPEREKALWKERVPEHARAVVSTVLRRVGSLVNVESKAAARAVMTRRSKSASEKVVGALDTAARALRGLSADNDLHDLAEATSLVLTVVRTSFLRGVARAHGPAGRPHRLLRTTTKLGLIYDSLVCAGRVGLVGEKPVSPRYEADLCEICDLESKLLSLARLDMGIRGDVHPHPTIRHKGLARGTAINLVEELVTILRGRRPGATTVRGTIERYEKGCRTVPDPSDEF
jgi:hypothetical protein